MCSCVGVHVHIDMCTFCFDFSFYWVFVYFDFHFCGVFCLIGFLFVLISILWLFLIKKENIKLVRERETIWEELEEEKS